MNFFTFDIKKLFIITALILAPLLMFNFQNKGGETPWFIKPFSLATGAVQNIYSSFSSGVRGTTGLYLNLVDIKKNNRLLLTENSELRAKLGEMTELNLENERLNKLIGFKQKHKMELLAAKVIGKDLLPGYQTITINRGTRNGIKAQMAVITVGGAVGYIFRPELYTSQIIVLTDRYASIDAIVQRSRARGIVEGKTKEFCKLSYVKRSDDVKAGDLIVTSGLDNIFPKGFPIGTVTSVVKSQYDVTQTIEMKPAVSPSNLEEIFVVLNSNKQSFSDEPIKKSTPPKDTP